MSYDRGVSADGSVAKLRKLFRWEINENGGVTITKFLAQKLKSVVVPAQIDGRPVVAIGDGAFSECSALREITFSDGLQSIGDGAFAWCSTLSEITFSAGLQSIGDGAFSDCRLLRKITLPAGLQSIGERAFSDCRLLSKITFPAGLQSIGDGAFSDCRLLSEITLPAGLQSIGGDAFSECSALSEITLPDGLQSIDNWAFSGCCSLTRFNVSPGNAFFKSVSGVLFSADGKTLVAYPIGRKETKFDVPNGVETIGSGAFVGCSLKKITLPNSLKRIDGGAFSECSALSEITLPDGLQSIDNWAFPGCCSLTRFNVSPGNAFFKSVSGVLFSADGKTLVAYPIGRKETKFDVPNGVETIGSGAFVGCSLKKITLPDGLQSIGDRAFRGCSLKEITIPASVREIGGSAFGAKITLRGVEGSFAEEYARKNWKAYDFKTLDGRWLVPSKFYRWLRLFSICLSICGRFWPLTLAAFYLLSVLATSLWGALFPLRGLEWNDVDGGVKITAFASSRSSVVIPAELDGKPVVAIGAAAFDGRDSLRKIELPDGVRSVEVGAFANCKNLTEIRWPKELRTIGEAAFKDCDSLTEIRLPDRLQRIGAKAFENCDSLTEIEIPASVYYIGAGALPTSLGEKYLTIYGADGCVDVDFATRNGCFLCVPRGEVGETPDFQWLAVADGVAIVKCRRQDATTIEIPAEIDGRPVVAVGRSAFTNCAALTKVVLPDGVRTVGAAAFVGCEALKTVVASDGLESIGVYAFCACGALEKVVWNDDLQAIGKGAFAGCKSLTEVALPTGLRTIETGAFWGCSSLAEVSLPEGLRTIGAGAFGWCDSLKAVEIPASVRRVEKAAFIDGRERTNRLNERRRTHALNERLAATMQKLEEEKEQAELAEGKGMILYGAPDSVAEECARENGLWFRPIAEDRVVGVDFDWRAVADGVEILRFRRRAAKEAVVPAQIDGKPVVAIADEAFWGCKSLARVSLPDDLRRIGDNAFAGCASSLTLSGGGGSFAEEFAREKRINFQDPAVASTPTFDWKAVDGGVEIVKFKETDATSVEIPAQIDGKPVVAIADEAFGSCQSLTTLAFPDGLRSVGDRAFYLCASLTEVEAPKSLETIGVGAFVGCDSLTSFSVSSENVCFKAVDGVLFSADGKTLVAYPTGRKATEYVVPDGVETIANGAFAFASLAEVAFPKSLRTIEGGAFSGCASLTEILLPEGLQTLGRNAFPRDDALTEFKVSSENAYFKAVDGVLFSADGKTLVAYPNGRKAVEYVVPNGVEAIGADAFVGSALTAIVLPNGLRRIDESAFARCGALQEVALPNGLQSIGVRAFTFCSSLKSVEVPTSVLEIAPDAFYVSRKRINSFVYALTGGSKNLTLYVVAGSYAEEYARERGLRFEAVDGGAKEADEAEAE